MFRWSLLRSPDGKKFVATSEAREFILRTRDVAPGWRGHWSLVPHVRANVAARHAGGVGGLVQDLLADFAPRKEGLLIATGVFSGARRVQSAWVQCSALSMDLDDGSDPDDLARAFGGYGIVLHGSWNDWRPKDGVRACARYRAYLFLARPITSLDDYALMWRWMESYCAQHGVKLDAACKDPNRIMYTLRDGSARPPVKPDHPSQWIAVQPGVPLDGECLPNSAALSQMRLEACRADEKSRKDARRFIARAGRVAQDDLRRAAHRRFAAAVTRLVADRKPGAGRNTGVFAAGALLGSYVSSGLYRDPEQGKDLIRLAAHAAGLDRDIDRQIENGFARGTENPLVIR
jgi:hypothetical protein